MTVKFVRFYDYVQMGVPQGLRIPDESKEKTKFIDSFISRNKHLLVTVRATHAARLTANNGFYFPDKMKKGAKSFLSRERGGSEPYDKPVLINHDRERDPIGRVITADYIDTTQQLKLSDSQRSIIKDLANTTQMWRAVDLVESLVKTGMLFDNDWQGLGYIKSTGNITDPNAIEKVLDRRYLTISTSADSDKAICSVCHEDWVAEGEPCEHRPGKIYDNKKCFIMAGNLFYNEWSYVNSPADAEAVTEGMQLIDMPIESGYKQITVDAIDVGRKQMCDSYISLNDSEDTTVKLTKDETLKKLTDLYPSIDADNLDKIKALSDDALQAKVDGILFATDIGNQILAGTLTLNDKGLDGSESHLETQMLVDMHNTLHYRYDYMLNEHDSGDKTVEIPKSVFTLHDKLMILAEENGFRDELINGKLDMINSDGEKMESMDSKQSTGIVVTDNKSVIQFDDLDIASDALTEEQAEFINDLLETEIDVMIAEGVTCTAASCEVPLADAKLSTSKRKSLPSASFCGPGRSFPVPDCAHVTAARRLIGRYKGPGNKDSILACVDRKAKAMGCDTKDAVTPVVVDKIELVTNSVLELSAEDQKKIYDTMTEKLVASGLIDAVAVKKTEELTAEIKVSQDKVATLEEQLQWLRVELRDTVSDYTQLSDRHEVVVAENHKLLATSTALIGLSTESQKTYSDLHAVQTNKSVIDLRSELQSMQDSVNFDSIVKKTNTKANDVLPPVIDPTLSDATKQNVQISDTISSDKWTTKIIARYKELRDKNGIADANGYIVQMKRSRYIPSNFDISKYLNEIQK